MLDSKQFLCFFLSLLVLHGTHAFGGIILTGWRSREGGRLGFATSPLTLCSSGRRQSISVNRPLQGKVLGLSMMSGGADGFELPEPNKKEMHLGRSIGIDLGTTNSAVAAVIDGKPVIIPNSIGARTTPSAVGFRKKAQGVDIIVGQDALELESDTSVFTSVKRVIGRNYTMARKVAPSGLSKSLVDSYEKGLVIKCPAMERDMLPEEISCHVIRRLKEDAERFLGENVTRAVITVPAYFTDAQRQATEAAGLLAGLEKIKLLREPEAAALAYGLDKLQDELIMVYDLGGGTLDVSVLEVGGGIIEVIWTGGDSFLGGDDFDKELSYMLAEDFVVEYGGSVSNMMADKAMQTKFLEAARKMKIRLSAEKKTSVSIATSDRGLTMEGNYTQKQLEQRCVKLIDRLTLPIRQVAIMAGIQLDGEMLGPSEEDEQELFVTENTDKPVDQYKDLKKQQQEGKKKAKQKNKRTSELHRVQKQIKGMGKLREFPVGAKLTEVVFVGGATRMPCVLRTVRALTGIQPRRTVDPDEAVALGAAVQAGVMDGDIQGFEVLSPLQAALLRGFARKKMKEIQGNYKPLMGDPATDTAEDADWDDEEWTEGEEWIATDDIAELTYEMTPPPEQLSTKTKD